MSIELGVQTQSSLDAQLGLQKARAQTGESKGPEFAQLMASTQVQEAEAASSTAVPSELPQAAQQGRTTEDPPTIDMPIWPTMLDSTDLDTADAALTNALPATQAQSVQTELVDAVLSEAELGTAAASSETPLSELGTASTANAGVNQAWGAAPAQAEWSQDAIAEVEVSSSAATSTDTQQMASASAITAALAQTPMQDTRNLTEDALPASSESPILRADSKHPAPVQTLTAQAAAGSQNLAANATSAAEASQAELAGTLEQAADAADGFVQELAAADDARAQIGKSLDLDSKLLPRGTEPMLLSSTQFNSPLGRPNEISPMPPPSPLPNAVPADQLAQQAVGVIRQLGEGRSEARLELHPAELGHLDMEVVQDGQRLEIKVAVENEQAKRLLQDQLQQWREKLGESGMDLQRLDVEVRDQSSHQRQEFDAPKQRVEMDSSEPVNISTKVSWRDPSRALDAYA